MSVPNNFVRAYAKYFLVYGHRWDFRVEDNNSAESDSTAGPNAHFGPLVRFGENSAPLMLMWVDVARVLDAGDSYQQEIGGQSGGSVASYSWSGGGSNSTKSYTFGSTGLEEVSVEVEDDNGIVTTGRRWVRVVDPPGTGPNPPITAFEWDGLIEQLPERGFGGASVRVRVWDDPQNDDMANTLQRGMSVSIYREEYEDGVLAASGEVFSGWIRDLEIEADPVQPSVTFVATTIEGMLGQEGMDSSVHIFIDATIQEELEVEDPFQGGLEDDAAAAIRSLHPFHVIADLTIGKTLYHLFRFHFAVTIDGDTRSVVDVVDFIRAWWRDGDPAVYKQWAFGLNNGPLLSQISGMLPQGVWVGFGKRSGLSVNPHFGFQVALGDVDATVAAVDEDLVYAPIRPIDGGSQRVRQVILGRTPSSAKDITTTGIISKYPATSDPVGSLYQPSAPIWVTTQEAADQIAEGLFRHLNANDMVELHLPGVPFTIFNVFTITLTGFSEFPWTNKKFYAVRVRHESDREQMGGHRTWVLGREVAA